MTKAELEELAKLRAMRRERGSSDDIVIVCSRTVFSKDLPLLIRELCLTVRELRAQLASGTGPG